MDGTLLQYICDSDWGNDLLQVLRSGGDVEQFIKNLEAAQRQKFLETDEDIVKNHNDIDGYLKKISGLENQIEKLEQEKNLAVAIKQKIDDLKMTYPKNKRRDLDLYLRNPKASYKEKLMSRPKGLIERIKSGKAVEAGNVKLEELAAFCEKNGIASLEKESDIIHAALRGEDIEGQVEYIKQEIENKTKVKECLIESKTAASETIQWHITLYDSQDRENSKYAKLRYQQRENIERFSQEYRSAMTFPETMAREEIARGGLSEEFIERQIMESQFPEKNLRSIRRSYEALDRPAAPQVTMVPQSRASETFADDVLEKLKQKGFDIVTETDARAVNPNIFVLDKTTLTIYSPFLSPEDALKANIAMIDAVYECGGEVSRSSLRTRETFAMATQHDLSGTGKSGEFGSLNLEIVAGHYSKERYDKVTDAFVLEFVENCDKDAFDQIVRRIGKDNPEKHAKLTESMRLYMQSEDFLKIEAGKRYSELAKKYKEDLKPYIKQAYQDMMVDEAFKKGIDPKIPDKENMLMFAEGKPPVSVFHGGQNGGMPYSVLCRDKRMSHTYGAATLEGGALEYAFGQSSHGGKKYETKRPFGFVYEYESRGEKQEMCILDYVGSFSDGKFDLKRVCGHSNETAVLPHQNKLKKVYIATKNNATESDIDRVFPLELDQDGNIADKRWRDFVELHNPVDDTMTGLMVDRQNNMIADYDATGREKMMERKLLLESKQTEKVAESVEHVAEKVSEKAGVKSAEKIMAETVSSSAKGVMETIKQADNAVNQAIETVIEKGSQALNNTKAGKVYEKAVEKVAQTGVGKAVGKVNEKISSGLMKTTAKIASTKAAKSAGKVATKVGAKAVGKSVLKKIPLISLGAGAYFAYDRIKHGEYKAAFCEMASGVAGCFPGLGTGISVAIDAGLAGNDIYSAVSAEKDVQVSSANDNKASKLAAKKVWIKSGRLQEQENKRPVQQTTVNVKDFIQDKIRA